MLHINLETLWIGPDQDGVSFCYRPIDDRKLEPGRKYVLNVDGKLGIVRCILDDDGCPRLANLDDDEPLPCHPIVGVVVFVGWNSAEQPPLWMQQENSRRARARRPKH